MFGFILGLILIFVLIVFIIGLYNRLVALKKENNKAWANIDVILKQRFDELPRLVEVCNNYIDYESKMIKKIMQAREDMVHGDKSKKIEASKAISAGVSGLLAIGESYPELKANENFMQIQSRVSSLEESLSDRREYYNNAVTNYNTRICQVPYNFLAGFLAYSEDLLYKVDKHEREVPELKFNKIS